MPYKDPAKRGRYKYPRTWHDSHLKRKYNFSVEQYDILLQSQNGKCAICESTEPGRKNKWFSVDHDHVSGRVRGLLCHQCNIGLGNFKDNPKLLSNSISYLQR